MQVEMSVNTKGHDPIKASAFQDEASLREFLMQIDSRLSHGAGRIQIDCSPLTRVTSSDVNSLWMAREKCEQNGSILELINVSDGLRRVLAALDLVDLFIPNPVAPMSHDLKFLPTVDDIDDAMSKLVRFLIKSGIPEATAFELQTIFYEVTTNIRRHGQPPSGESIGCEIRIDGRTVNLVFTDGGLEFDPTGRDTNFDFRDTGHGWGRSGFGLAMIRRLSDSLEYRRTPKSQNQLNIKKGW